MIQAFDLRGRVDLATWRLDLRNCGARDIAQWSRSASRLSALYSKRSWGAVKYLYFSLKSVE